jgi:hypothetical protein
MEKLQMLKYAIRKGTYLNFTDGFNWEDELIEIEELQKDHIPSDMTAYTKALDIEEDDGDEDWEDMVEIGDDEDDGEEVLLDDDNEDNEDNEDDGLDYEAMDE